MFHLSVWLHILAATVWIGSMFFLVLVVAPWLRRSDRALAASFFRETGPRLRSVAWISFGVLLVTGTFNLWVRGVRLGDLARTEWLGTDFGTLVVLKLGVFAGVLGLSAVHDFIVGPKATRAIADGAAARAGSHRRRATLFGRVNMVLALVLVALGVALVRGIPF